MECLAEGRGTYDLERRHETYVRCQQIMYDSAYWGFVWRQHWNYLLGKRVRGFRPARAWGQVPRLRLAFSTAFTRLKG